MKKIRIPFMDVFEKPLKSGMKRMTSRNKKYGNVGDIFYSFGMKFKITKVYRCPLDIIHREFYIEEGCDTPQEFKNIWMKIHRKWQPMKDYWVHEFIEC